jgi:hypothetical protein
VRLADERRLDVPATVIACAVPSATLREWMRQGEPALQELSRIRDLARQDLPTGHCPQLTRPADLAHAILAAIGAG